MNHKLYAWKIEYTILTHIWFKSEFQILEIGLFSNKMIQDPNMNNLKILWFWYLRGVDPNIHNLRIIWFDRCEEEYLYHHDHFTTFVLESQVHNFLYFVISTPYFVKTYSQHYLFIYLWSRCILLFSGLTHLFVEKYINTYFFEVPPNTHQIDAVYIFQKYLFLMIIYLRCVWTNFKKIKIFTFFYI